MVLEQPGAGGAPLCLETSMDLTDELRMLAEDLYVNGYNRYSAAMSKAADELDKWEAVFGHLGGTPDECGNAIIAARDELEERARRLESALESLLIRCDDSDSAMYGTLSTSFVRDTVRIARGEQE